MVSDEKSSKVTGECLLAEVRSEHTCSMAKSVLYSALKPRSCMRTTNAPKASASPGSHDRRTVTAIGSSR